jgi:hypothetical protein
MRLYLFKEDAIHYVSVKGISCIMCFESSSRGGFSYSYCEFHNFSQLPKAVETIRCNEVPSI